MSDRELIEPSLVRATVSDHSPYADPTKVDAVDGAVTLDGPDGVDVSMTSAAARETARRLLSGAAKADGQSPKDKDKEGEDEPPVDDFA